MRKTSSKLKWSKEEEEALKTLFPLLRRGLISKEELCSVFRDRSWEAIRIRALSLGLPHQIRATIDRNLLSKLVQRGKI
mgnify:CR=1 FL=1